MMRMLAGFLLALGVALPAWAYTPQEGDILFQTSRSSQSVAIQKATHSPYSHVAIVLFRHGQPYVFEAAQPVRFTPLGEWEARGKDGHFIAKRSRKSLSPATIVTFHRLAARYAGKPYDFTFEWSDERMYCSELVWKLYKGAHITLAPLARLGSFDLRDPLVRKIVKQRYGNHVPLDEPVVTPAALFNSPLLVTVADERASRTR